MDKTSISLSAPTTQEWRYDCQDKNSEGMEFWAEDNDRSELEAVVFWNEYVRPGLNQSGSKVSLTLQGWYELASRLEDAISIVEDNRSFMESGVCRKELKQMRVDLKTIELTCGCLTEYREREVCINGRFQKSRPYCTIGGKGYDWKGWPKESEWPWDSREGHMAGKGGVSNDE